MAARIADQLIDDATITIVVVGSVDETPVSCSMLSVTGATAGIDDVATAVQHRGYGAALTWASIEHGAPQGYDHSILPASEIGAPVDRAMSFADTAFADVGNALSSKDRHPALDRVAAPRHSTTSVLPPHRRGERGANGPGRPCAPARLMDTGGRA